MHNMKHLNTYITEYIIKKKLDKPINSEDHYEYFPETKDELTEIIQTLLNKGETNLNCIDTSAITDMSYLFKSLNISTTIDVSRWDVSNVTDMSYMFHSCKNFDCDLSNWDVSNVKNMNGMFKDCKNFEGNGLENWNVKNTKTMRSMFYGCNKLKNIPSWYKD